MDKSSIVYLQSKSYLLKKENDTDIVEIGAIDFVAELNDVYTTGVDEVIFQINNVKEVGKLLSHVLFKTTESIVSYSGVSVVKITGEEKANLSVTGSTFPSKGAAHVNVTLKLSANNVADWTSGTIKIYAVFLNYPEY